MKIDRKAFQKDRERLQKNLRIIQKNFKSESLAKILGISRSTWFRRANNPEALTYSDFRAISRFTGISIETIVSGEVGIK